MADEKQKHTFGKERRLRKRSEFMRVQDAGVRVNAPHFLFLLQPRIDRDGPSRLGLVASKRVGNAVARNRVKRVCRACFRLSPGIVPPGIDLVVIPRPGSDQLDLETVMGEWRRAARNLEQKSRMLLAQATGATQVAAQPAPETQISRSRSPKRR